MRKELDEKLCRDYPEIFKNRNGNIKETAMIWGFSCGDGWYPIIDFLCSAIMNRCRRAKDRVELLKEALSEDQSNWDEWKKKAYNVEKLAEAEKEFMLAQANIPVATQVKEKFGGLRFYVSGGDETTHNMISMVEALSYRVCEECGTTKDAQLYSIGWNKTLCIEHAEQNYGKDAKEYREGNLVLP